MHADRSVVPCNGCNACCQGDAVVIYPEHGDRRDDYLTQEVDLPVVGVVSVLRKTDGHCIYLRDGACSIWARAPHMCRIFDCRKFYLSRSRPERRRMVKAGMGSQEVMIAGRERLHTLTEAERENAARQRALGDLRGEELRRSRDVRRGDAGLRLRPAAAGNGAARRPDGG